MPRYTTLKKGKRVNVWLGALVVFLMIVGIGAAIFLMSSSLDIRQQASETVYKMTETENACSPGDEECIDGSYKVCQMTSEGYQMVTTRRCGPVEAPEGHEYEPRDRDKPGLSEDEKPAPPVIQTIKIETRRAGSTVGNFVRDLRTKLSELLDN